MPVFLLVILQDRNDQARLIGAAGVLDFQFIVHIYPMAGQEGIEPPTCGFGDRRSAN